MGLFSAKNPTPAQNNSTAPVYGQRVSNSPLARELWENKKSIYISNQHISGNLGNINCTTVYFPSAHAAVCCTEYSGSRAEVTYDLLQIPPEVRNSTEIIRFIQAHTPWLVFGFTPSDKLLLKLDIALNYTPKTLPKASEDYYNILLKVAIDYLPKETTPESLPGLFDLIGDILKLDRLKSDLMSTSWRKVMEIKAISTPEEKQILLNAISDMASTFNKILESEYPLFLEHTVNNASEETLLKAVVGADYLGFSLQSSSANHLDKFAHLCANELLSREYMPFSNKYEMLRHKLNKAQKSNVSGSDTDCLLEKLVSELLQLDKIYILADEDFNPDFPYITTSGALEIFTNLTYAQNASKHFAQENEGHTSIREIPKERMLSVFTYYNNLGIFYATVDNGVMPVRIPINKITDNQSANIIERKNQNLKGMFLRELQYGYRIKKLPADAPQEAKTELVDVMLTMRYNAYRTFANTLCYVLLALPHTEGRTLYTPAAFEKAKEMAAQESLDTTALLAKGDTSIGIYNSEVNLRVTQKPNQSPSDALVCVFTGREEAEKVRLNFKNYGIDDSILAITYDELKPHAQQCAGIIVDMPTYGLQLAKDSDFAEIERWRNEKDFVVIHTKKPE